MANHSIAMVETLGRLVRNALRPGTALPSGSIIESVERVENGARYVISVSPASLRVIVEVPRPDNAYTAAGAGVGMWVDASAGRRDGYPHEPLCRELVARLSIGEVSHEGDVERVPTRAAGSKPTLYLVPGHLGDPEDISIRTRQVLASVSVIFVESQKAEEVRALLARFDLRPMTGPGAAEVMEIDPDDPCESRAVERLRESVAAGLDACLFGANEGIPAFCDPGKEIVIAASGMSDTVDVRSVGGSSVLGHALMRIPAHLGAFEFAGLLYSAEDVVKVCDVPTSGRLPVVLFSQGHAVRAHLPAVLERRGLRRGTVHLVAALTSTEEQSFAIELTGFAAPSPHELPDHRATVIVIDPNPSRNSSPPS